LETKEGLFFAVKGSLLYGDLVLAVLRYIPHPQGDRVLEGRRYRRIYNLEWTTRFLAEHYPHYLNHVDELNITTQAVPLHQISRAFRAREGLADMLEKPVSPLQRKLSTLVDAIVEESDVPMDCLGVSGSLLIGLGAPTSDLDLLVYGEPQGKLVYRALRRLRERRVLHPLSGGSLEEVLGARWGDTGISLDRFRELERGKLLHGLAWGTPYFIRLLRREEATRSKPLGKATIRAKVEGDNCSIFTPCSYSVRSLDEERGLVVTEFKSYRGKFTEQAKRGQEVLARGTLERVEAPRGEYFRLMLGGKGNYVLPVDGKSFSGEVSFDFRDSWPP